MNFLKENSIPVLIGTITVAVLGFIMLSPVETDEGGVIPTEDLVTSTSIIAGEATASATLVEFSDFQCPACASSSALLEKVKAEYDEGLQFVYKHYPLPQHKNAQLAAEASEAANAQGKFWKYHNILFLNQEEWSELDKEEVISKFVEYAGMLDLDTERFKDELESGKYLVKVSEDVSAGRDAGVDSTPTIFLNGKKIIFRSYEQLKVEIESVLE